MTRKNAKKNFSVWNRLSKRLRSWLWNLVWRDGSMTNPRRALTLLDDRLAQLSRRREGDLAMGRFTRAGLAVEPASDLSTWVHLCGGPGGAQRRAHLLEGLVALSPGDETAALCVLVALRPELKRMARLLARGPLDLEEAESEMVAIAWQVVTRPGADRPSPTSTGSLVNAIWTETRRSAGLRRRHQVDVIALAEGLDLAGPESDPLERWPGLLATAVARGVLTPRQVVIIARTRMDQRPLTEVAAELGRPYDAVCQERWRAEAELRKFALAYISGDSE
jgi:hypothetical protein